jgi:hypothetical protein
MDGREDNAKRFALSSRPSIKGLMLFSLSRWGISRSSSCESPPDECFNPPLELFLPVLDGRFRLFALLRVRFASKGVLMRTQFTSNLAFSGLFTLSVFYPCFY